MSQGGVVIGGGPAGLAAGHDLGRRGMSALVLEGHVMAGGLARTESYAGYRFDMGGHRFFSHSPIVQHIWHETLPKDLLSRPRMSRICRDGIFFDYPLKLRNVVKNLGVAESGQMALSWARAAVWPARPEETFEVYVKNRFGRRLHERFFRDYTEKVWGIPCSELRAEWAAQRIAGLSFKTAVLGALRRTDHRPKTLIDHFHYPRLGPGMMWEAMCGRIREQGGDVRTNSEVVSIRRDGERIAGVVVGQDGRREEIGASLVLSSMPLRDFVLRLEPEAPVAVQEAARRLRHRDFLMVGLIVDRPELFADQWIYVHDRRVRLARIQNFKNWSEELLADPGKTSLGLEYFCTRGDDLWNMPDQGLIEQGKRELERIGLAEARHVVDGCVFRVSNAYPVYDSEYFAARKLVREYVSRFGNLQMIGRNGLHRYDNMDQAMLTGLLGVRNLLDGRKADLWDLNADLAALAEQELDAGG